MDRNQFISAFNSFIETKGLTNAIKSVASTKIYRVWLLENTKFLDDIRKKPAASERVFCIINNYNSVDDLPTCIICGKTVSFLNYTDGYNNCCSSMSCNSKRNMQNERERNGGKYQFQTREFKNKSKSTFQEKYGVDNAMQCSEIREKQKGTIQSKYGVDNVSKLDEIKQKKIETSREHYGTDYPWQSELGKQEQKAGVFAKYGVENTSSLDWVKEKREKTSYENWGVRNPSQSLTIRKRILESNGWEYERSDGETVMVDSKIEEKVIEYLLSVKYDFDAQPEMKIEYTVDGKDYVYFPDMYISDTNTIIEVKHFNTLSLYKSEMEAQLMEAANVGYNVKIIGIVEYKDRGKDKQSQLISLSYNVYNSNWIIDIINRNDNFDEERYNSLVNKLNNYGLSTN